MIHSSMSSLCQVTQRAVVFAIFSLLFLSSQGFAEDALQELRMRSYNVSDAAQPRHVEKIEVPQPHPEPKEVPTYKILIDPGHGGRDIGAQGLFGISEKNLSLKIGKLVKREIEKYFNTRGSDIPVEVEMTRDDDAFVALKDRVNAANSWGADLFVSIHGNSSPYVKARGFEVYFLNAEASDEEAKKLARVENSEHERSLKYNVMSMIADVQATYHISESSQFAEMVFSSLSMRVPSSGRGVRQAPFTVLHGTTMPAILVEVGYLTNILESKNLTREPYLKRLANAISTGIVDFAVKKKKIS
jgi:N-acetylmuramoyl-L-alanine amidase